MESMRTNNLTDMIAKADFSAETGFKDVLRKRLFEKKSNVFQFQRLSDADLDMVSAAGDASLLNQLDKKETDK